MKHFLHLPPYTSMLRSLAFSLMLGIGGALVVWLFHQAMLGCEWLFLEHHQGSLVHAAHYLPPWRRLLTPALGGLAAGFVLWWYQKHPHYPPAPPVDYIETIDKGDGHLDLSACLVKGGASLLAVTTGSAIGSEGAMVMLAALFASLVAQRLTPRNEWKHWVVCGVAAGMASAYHAPLAAGLFVAEIFFFELKLPTIIAATIAAASAMLVTNLLNGGPELLYRIPEILAPLPVHYVVMGGVGLVMGLAGPLFLRLAHHSQHFFHHLPVPLPARLGLAGLIVGLLSLPFPEVWGNGYSVIQSFLGTPPAGGMIALILLCKLVAILACNGSGTPGGIFTPTLFIGAATGVLLFQTLPAVAGNDALLLTLAGMATLLAATTHAPLMSAAMVTAMTGAYTALPALLLACLIASRLSRALTPGTSYRPGEE